MISSNILPNILSKKFILLLSEKIAKKKTLIASHYEDGGTWSMWDEKGMGTYVLTANLCKYTVNIMLNTDG
jgi:hypothetical protein